MSVLKALEQKTFLTFRLGDEVFAVDVQHVHEVLDFRPSTQIPGSPDFMTGIINLRGHVVPVVDMRRKFGLPEAGERQRSRIIVLDVGVGEKKTTIGALTDSVREVFEFEPGQIEPPPRFGDRDSMDFIQGIGKREDQFVIILNFNKVFSTQEVVMLGTAGDQEADAAEVQVSDDGGREE